jgi:hypothetical protein
MRVAASTPTVANNRIGDRVLAQLSKLKLQAAFEQQRGKEYDECDVGRQPVRVSTDQGLQDRQMNNAQDEPAENECHGIGDSEACGNHGDDGGRNQKP